MHDWYLTGLTYLALFSLGTCIECYYCNNGNNGACGEEFKSYQFQPYHCPEADMKCGKQTQPPLESGWVGVFRTCYSPGTLPGINETNGCHYWTNPVENFTALFCFCDTDRCNGGKSMNVCPQVIAITIVLSAVILHMQNAVLS